MDSVIPHSAKAVLENNKLLDGYMNYMRVNAIRAREVEDSILSMNEKQEKANTYLEHGHKLTQNQIELMSMLVEAQNAIRQEQVRNAEETRRSSQIQFWMNLFILVLTIVGVGYAVADFHKK